MDPASIAAMLTAAVAALWGSIVIVARRLDAVHEKHAAELSLLHEKYGAQLLEQEERHTAGLAAIHAEMRALEREKSTWQLSQQERYIDLASKLVPLVKSLSRKQSRQAGDVDE